MQFDAHCMECLVRRQFKLALKHDDGEQAAAYLREVMQAMLDAPKGVSAPWLTQEFTKLYAKYWPGEDAYAQLKRESNDLVLQLLPEVRPVIAAAADPLELALIYARTGNFLDFGILTPEIAHEALWKALREAPSIQLNQETYRALRTDLESARQLVILGDNAGEIAFDTLLVEQLQKQYPRLSITYCVRGANAMNDATREDAAYVGMDKLCAIVDNGSGISGTEMDYIGEELREALNRADVILSKGSGNLESMGGCGLNVYYLFMCKCKRMSKVLGCPNMTAQFLRERALPPLNPLVGAVE